VSLAMGDKRGEVARYKREQKSEGREVGCEGGATAQRQ